MTWEVASFLILGSVLLAGFAWYERSRPPAQVVALVALLAALAIAGRVAFAAFPNVKPTTDIVIFAGYALGPAPGFAVGALTALVSNFWFGQGPWTPWQMAGWGLCGLLGAALGLRKRETGRLTLALVCAFAGIAYGALLNFSLMATYGGDLSLQRFLVLESRAVPFDAAHAIGNFVFAFVAGPAMVRMLGRFRERFEWRLPAAATTLVALIVAAALLPAQAHAANVGSATRWLVATQNQDGGFPSSTGEESDTMTTAWAMLGLEAAGRNPLDVVKSGRTPVDFLRANVKKLRSSGDLARTIVALEGAGVNPRSFGGENLVATLAGRRAANGSFEGWPGTTAFSVIALRRAGASGGLNKTLSWLAGVQNKDGGWGDVPGRESNADVTGLVMQAMPGTQAGDKGLDYLRKAQRQNGGFALGGSGAVNSQSTAWAVQGMIAVGASAQSIKEGGNSALDYLDGRQAADGHFSYSSSSDQTPVWVTAQALVAAAGKSFPIPPPARTSLPVSPESTAGAAPAGVPAPTPSFAPSTAPESGGGGTGGAKKTGPFPSVNAPNDAAIKPPAKGSQNDSITPAPQPAASPGPSFDPTGSDTSPWAPLAIGLACGGLALGSVLVLGRRFGW
jgi:energy-coupling factor transport system substrate-specific component